jgi:FtsP/CotA-like multicopper oxidase with cupredoxin domain
VRFPLLAPLGCLLLVAPGAGIAPIPGRHSVGSITFNDNRIPAGTISGGAQAISLVVDTGSWRPFGNDHPGVPLLVFGEAGRGLQDPGPMIRVARGTLIRATIQNRSGARLVIHGLSARRNAMMDTVVIAPGATDTTEFRADAEGTFYYWGSTHGDDFLHRELDDAHLNGALIVDAPGVPRADRVFVIERNSADTTADGQPDYYHDLFTINGRPWPNTERLTYQVGDSVRWRIINASNDVHPLHLHGFYYRVNARGDLARDTVYWASQQRSVVTETLWEGTTMDMAWRPDRPGDWIFHCHFPPHVIPNTGIGADTEPLGPRMAHVINGYPAQAGMNHAMTGMGGLVMGIVVRAPAGWHSYTGERRTMRLTVESDSAAGDSTRMFRYLSEGNIGAAARPERFGEPGPPLILRRGEPTRIWVVNHTPEMTQVHWHGLEIESFYDGVAGFSGSDASIEPPIMPGDSFEVRVTPPRAGTFIYHTHVNDVRQLSHGLYGPLIVLDSAEQWNPATDRTFILGDDTRFRPALNGSATPSTLTLKAGTSYRFRLINISIAEFDAVFSLLHDGAPIRWTPLAKDGATLPRWQADERDATQPLSIGETFDFTVQSKDTLSTVLDLRHRDGTPMLHQMIHFVK